MKGKSIFAMDLTGVQSVVTAGIILMLQLRVESLGTQQMVSQALFTFKINYYKSSPCTSGARPTYYISDVIVIENINCYLDEPRLRDCLYSISLGCQNGGVAGFRCKVIKNIDFATVNNSVLVTWEYNNITSHQPSSFDVRRNGQ